VPKLKVEVRIAGLGGQGVVLAGQILGRAAVHEDFNAVQTQSYGAEARGSAAKSEVIISDAPIWFPYVRKCDVLVALSQEAFNKYAKALKENGILIIDSTFVKNVSPNLKAKVFSFPFSKIAEERLGAKIFANIVVLGFLAKITNLISKEALEKAVVESIPVKFKDLNLKALEIGFKL
jgi:2-oxoglutarate ferredoxin oxidoreductase subunit gamma